MYITSSAELRDAVASRKEKRSLIRARQKEFLEAHYGVQAMQSIVPVPLREEAETKGLAVLARQIASVCAEDFAFDLSAKALGMRPLTITFVRDAFTKGNHDKLRRVEVPWVSWSKKDAMMLAFERLSPKSNGELDCMPLSSIMCGSGIALPRKHRELRRAAGLHSAAYDISSVHSEMLQSARKRPEFVFRAPTKTSKEERVSVLPNTKLLAGDRPPSSWYYPYYLSWFLDGTTVLFETYDNPIGDVSLAKALFEECVRTLERATGFAPLVVKIPPLSERMLYCNRHLLWNASALSELQQQVNAMDQSDTVALFETAAEAVIRYR